jgi:hypothetical protein
MSRATSLAAVAQQLSVSFGVAAGALLVDLTLRTRGHSAVMAADFQPAFVIVALIAASSCFVFAHMPQDAGAELARRTPSRAREPQDKES